MTKKVNHFKDELWRTFTVYALIPTFIISLFIFVLAFVYWNINVVEKNQSRLNQASEKISTTIASYVEQAEKIAAESNIKSLQTDQGVKVSMYQRLYHYANNTGLQTEFYLYDQGMNRLVSNQARDPEFIQVARKADWGIVGQIKRTPAMTAFGFVSPINSLGSQMDLVVGKAIFEGGTLTGYIFFVLPQEQIFAMVSNPNVHFVIKDRYDYTAICTDDFFHDEMNKMKTEFIDAKGYFPLAGRKYYISQRELLNGELTAYAFTSVGGIVSQLTNTLLMLMGVLLVLSLSIVLSVKKQVEEKTKMMDQLVEAFSAVKQGNLDMRLDIHTDNEFQIIGDSYNLMLSSLKELMEINHEKARATVISEIKQLESQFNPHFLFNTLENIKFMIKLDPLAANRMIVALSNLLRYSIDNNRSEVTIQEDMAYTQNYLDIQKLRFGQRLNYILEVPQELNTCIVPKLIIQPIIENAVKYGFCESQHLLVKVEGTITANQLVISIQNNGTKMTESSLKEIRAMLASTTNSSQHTGLYNVNRRIQLMYGEEYGLSITSSQKEGTRVTISLPVLRQPE